MNEHNVNNNNDNNSNSPQHNKYQKLLDNFETLCSSAHEPHTDILIDDIASTFTLGQLIHIQTINPLYTFSDSLDECIQIGKSETLNDVFIYYYTNHSTVYPIIYNQILSITLPDDFSEYEDDLTFLKEFPFLNKKCIVFTCNDLINKTILIEDYIKPILNRDIKYANTKTKHFFTELFISTILNNIYIMTYHSSIELLIKINNLYNILQNELKDVALIIIDCINNFTSHKIDFDVLKENDNTRKIDINFKKKRHSYLKDRSHVKNNNKDNNNECINDNEIIYAIMNCISNLYQMFNFNYIITCFDYDNYSHLKYVSSGKNFMFDTKRNQNIVLDNKGISFNFRLPNNINKHIVYIIEPIYNILNCDEQYFGVMTLKEENMLMFKVFVKVEEKNGVDELYTTLMEKIDNAKGNNSGNKMDEDDD